MEKHEGKSLEAEPKLPRASVDKIVEDTLTAPLTCSRDVKYVLLDGCAKLIHIISAEANRACEREQKKTVTHEHVYVALRQIGLSHYIEECHNAYKEHVEQSKLRPSKQNKLKESGLTEDELEREQEELFRKAKLLSLTEEKDQSNLN
ncbi:down-regulator of transcription 1 [Nematocida sp. LUAm3]|nr:down-regulator of transcription 1 [Nematocida sp. LUAm3]KAI5173568.1 down-regulator of transcription 1 [Nematocida sp. LUAm2]KAI5176789.1 down-regulator of transcription 1 [Nematocida sp. LUAm1]